MTEGGMEMARRAVGLDAAARADTQGLVTSGFGHLPACAYGFARFKDREAAQRWLASLLPAVTTAVSWRTAPDRPKARPEATLNVAFTVSGLRALGLGESVVGTFPGEFVQGMAHPERSVVLGDTGSASPERWSIGGPGQPVDVLLVICGRDADWVEREMGTRLEGLRSGGGGEVVGVEAAYLPVHGREHFGFRDGIAGVEIQGITGRGIRTGECLLGYENEYGICPPTPLVRAGDDPRGVLAASANPFHTGLGWKDLGLHGTYLVYRKLVQRVAAFWGFMEAESRRWRGVADPRFMVWLASKAVGRWPNGAPLTLAPDGDEPELRDQDDFLYAEADSRGYGCPFAAHIRRANPRDMIRPAAPPESSRMSARHRLLRRGRVFGEPLFDPTALDRAGAGWAGGEIVGMKDDGRERGLHFVVVNASLRGQFEFVQQSWMNNPHFNGVANQSDPLSSRSEGHVPDGFVVPRPGLDLRTAPVPNFVEVRGGGYFFMPSLRALRYLGGEGV